MNHDDKTVTNGAVETFHWTLPRKVRLFFYKLTSQSAAAYGLQALGP